MHVKFEVRSFNRFEPFLIKRRVSQKLLAQT